MPDAKHSEDRETSMFAPMTCSRWRAPRQNPSIRSFFRLHDTQAKAAHFSQVYGQGRTLASTPITRPSPFTSRRNAGLYGRGSNHYSDPNTNYTFNRTLTYGCIGSAVIVYAAWDYSNRGIIYSIIDKQRALLKSLGISLPRELRTLPVSEFLRKYFLLHANDTSPSFSWLGSAFSHQSILHMGVNLLVWSNFAALLFPLPRIHYATIVFGSALASSAAWIYDARRKSGSGAALGSSGIVSGVMMTATMFYPTLQASLFGIVPMPLCVLTGGFLALDYYLMGSGGASRVGHSAHLGGAAFGFLYYTVFLRRYGGIFGSRRF